MSEISWHFIAATLSLAGMAWLALAMDVHWGQVMHQPAEAATTSRHVFRVLGTLALPLSLLVCLMADRPSMAVLVWLMMLAGSACLVAMTLTYRPAWLRLMCLVNITRLN